MSSNEKKLSLEEAVKLTGYLPTIKQDFAKFLESVYGSQKHKLYLFSRNEKSPKLFLLQLQIPSKFNNQPYDISLLVYFPINFPKIEPEIFFEKIGKVKINPNCEFYIDPDTLKINYSLFYSWENSLESFRNLINELYNQFNIAFPVFNLTNKNDNENSDPDKDEDKGDCVLKLNLCKEIELIKPEVRKMQNKRNIYQINNIQQNNIQQNNIQQNNIQQNNIQQNNIQQNNEKSNINPYNKNPPNVKTNIYGRPINEINDKPTTVNPYIPVFDEKKAKLALINVLKNSLSQKINYAIQPITASYLKLEKLKENITKKLKDFDVVESKENKIRETIDTLHKDMNFTIAGPKEIENPDLANLESILIISNKDYYLRLAKEKTIEEYILLVKKSYEKQNIDFNTALNLIRINSRNIFFLKYKDANPIG